MSDSHGTGEETPVDGRDEGQARIYPLIADDGNRDRLVDWLQSQEQCVAVTGQALGDATFDLCLVDREGLERHGKALKERKQEAQPLLLPCLYLLPESSTDFLETEYAQLGETFVEANVDEVLSTPVRQAELEWRMDSLLRMRAQTKRLLSQEQSLRRFRRAIEAAGQAIFITDTEGTITYVNPAFEDVTGYTPEEAIGATPALFSSGEMDDAYYESLWETILAGNTWRAEIINERKDGKQYTAVQTIAPVPDENGEVTRFVAIQTDVTEQKQLEKRQRQYQQAIENSVELLAAVDDDDDRYLFANDTYRSYHGLGETEAVQDKQLSAVLTESEYEVVEPHLERVRDGETVEFQTTRTHPEMGERILDILYYPLRDDDGDIQGVIGSMRDVTDQRERSRRLQTLIDNLPGIVYRCHDSPGWPMDFVGGQCESITGYTAAQLESDEVRWGADVVHPDDQAEIEETIAAARDDGEPFELSYRIQTATGETRWVHERGQKVSPLTASEPMLEGFIMDVTERKEREKALRQRGRAMDEAPIGITISDPTQEDNPLVYVNEGFTSMTGYDREEALGRNCRFLQGERTDPETVATVREHIDAAEPVSVVIRNYRADGTEFWNNLSVAPVRDGNGDLVNYVGFQQDVTDRVQRQQQLQKIDQVLRHNLHNDLNIVQLHAEQMQEESDQSIVTSAQKILETIERLIDTMDKEREVVQVLEKEPNLQEVSVVSTLGTLVDSLEKEFPDARLTLTAPETATAQGTPELSIALEELLRNAIEHNDSEEPTVEVTVRSATDTVTVEIADNGPGIPEMEANVLTGEQEETPLYHGRGIGLWLVSLVVRRCEGTVDLSDTADGNVVTVSLSR